MIRHVELNVLIQTLIAAEQDSFHKAGQLLGIPASTVSRRVRSLETQLGVRLFERHRHGIRPTAASDAFLKPIRRILDDLNTVLINAKAIARGNTGSLNIGLYVSPSSGHLRATIHQYKQALPECRCAICRRRAQPADGAPQRGVDRRRHRRRSLP